jgi:hypothetical protein
MNARRSTLTAFASLGALTVALLLWSVPALAARGHIFGKTFGEPCSTLPSEPCLEGHDGQFNEPSGVAVNEATGDVYVVDKGDERVQWFSSTGEYKGQFNGPSAKGEGTLLAGSQFIEFVATTAGKFSVGEEISGEDIPAGTTIEEVVGEGSLKISQPAEATPAAAVLLAAHQAFLFLGPTQGSPTNEAGIAVDNACRLHGLTETTTPTCAEFDPSNGDVYVDDRGGGEEQYDAIDKFSPEGVYLGQIPGSEYGVSVDAAGNVWLFSSGGDVSFVSEYTNAKSNVLEKPTHKLQDGNYTFPQTGFAVDAEDDFYTLRGTLTYGVFAYKNGHSGPLRLNGGIFEEEYELLLNPVDEEQASSVAVELSSDDSYVDNFTSVGRFGPSNGLKSGALLERLGEGHLTRGAGVGVSSSSEDVYVADQAANKVDAFVSEPAGSPVVTGEATTQVAAGSATLEAEVNPRSEPGEPLTEYRFEYGRCASLSACADGGYEQSAPVPDDSLPADFNVHHVSVSVQGLAGGAVYHFRVVAENEHGGKRYVTDGERNTSDEEVVQTFSTQAPGGFVLADGREWEMVSPADKHGAQIGAINEASLIKAAAEGGAMTYETFSPTESDPPGFTNSIQVLSTRGPASWESRDIDPPNEMATSVAIGAGKVYRFFSENLSLAILQPFGPFVPSLSAEASEQTAFEHTDFLSGNVSEPCVSPAMHCYRPLVTGAAGFANVPEGVHFGEQSHSTSPLTCPPAPYCGPEFLDASPDGSSVVLGSSVGLTPGTSGGLYEWSDGELKSISPVGDIGTGHNLRHAISNDGSRVFWSASHRIYMTDTVDGKSIEVDTGLGGASTFQTASSDGSMVFFTQGSKEERGGELYVCKVGEGVGGEPECELSDLTPGAEIKGTVIVGASEDGSYVYFVSDGVLASGAKPGTSSTTNLYVMHDMGGRWETRLVAAISTNDSPDFASGLGGLTARVSPDGRWLAFMSQRELTGYDNHDAVSGEPDEEVYLYHAPEMPATEPGALVCASCNPTGARPIGVEYGSAGEEHLHLVGGDGVWPQSTWIAANIPGWTPYRLSVALYQSRYLSNAGRLFFNARDPLVPQAVNGNEDVYEYEPADYENGEGRQECTRESMTFSEHSDGCVGLISSGESANESAFLDASESGGDVFFLTNAKLVSQDYDTLLDVYDAHECTSAEPCFPASAAVPPPCDTEASCKAAPTPQPEIFGAPSSETFSGAGNIVPSAPVVVKPKAKPTKCKKNFVKKKSQCVKKKKTKKRAQASKASNDRRASR